VHPERGGSYRERPISRTALACHEADEQIAEARDRQIWALAKRFRK
jgi:hypothetical protein